MIRTSLCCIDEGLRPVPSSSSHEKCGLKIFNRPFS
nr:MAG TPA: hypothetical protein [Caudoviricetes sp.]